MRTVMDRSAKAVSERPALASRRFRGESPVQSAEAPRGPEVEVSASLPAYRCRRSQTGWLERDAVRRTNCKTATTTCQNSHDLASRAAPGRSAVASHPTQLPAHALLASSANEHALARKARSGLSQQRQLRLLRRIQFLLPHARLSRGRGAGDGLSGSASPLLVG
ncbi:hypothetical protein L1887_47816 [Cichorium endivia]|nr:hypothetical protein L1887_47816 [Cichorium endivia]